MDMLIANRKFFIVVTLYVVCFLILAEKGGLNFYPPNPTAGRRRYLSLLADADGHAVFKPFLPGSDEGGTSKILRVDDFREIAVHDSSDDL